MDILSPFSSSGSGSFFLAFSLTAVLPSILFYISHLDPRTLGGPDIESSRSLGSAATVKCLCIEGELGGGSWDRVDTVRLIRRTAYIATYLDATRPNSRSLVGPWLVT